MGNGRLTICQISDIHCGNARFIPELLDRTIIEINRANPMAVVVSGDLTDAGYREEFEQAAEYIARIECENIMTIPGNHDSRNVGYVHFERLFGERQSVMDLENAILVGVDSSEPDLNDGQVGREHPGSSKRPSPMPETNSSISLGEHPRTRELPGWVNKAPTLARPTHAAAS
jgi:Icc protein